MKKLILLLLSFLLLFHPLKAFAVKVFFEGYVALESAKLTLTGELPGEQFGAVLGTGDLNEDEIQDLIIGSPFASIGDKEWNGRVGVFLGKSNVKEIGTPDFLFYGEYDGDQLGTSLVTGDFNDDGYDDLAMGAYNAFPLGNRPGKVYVMYGPLQLTSQLSTGMSSQADKLLGTSVIDFALMPADLELTGEGAFGKFGLSLASVDIDNNGIDDLVVGAPATSAGQQLKNAGMVYTFWGSVKGLSETNRTRFYGQQNAEAFGSEVIGGKFDGKKNSLIVSAYLSDNGKIKDAGKIYYFEPLNNYTENIKDPSATFSGESENGWMGFDLATGNLNNDKQTDLAVSSFNFKGDNSKSTISVFYGNADFEEFTRDILISDPLEENLLGASIVLKDLNGDHKDDIILGAPGISITRSNQPGDVYIIYSKENSYESQYSIKNNDINVNIHGENADDWFGYVTTVLDLNHDKYRDLVIGSRYSDAENAVNSGKVFVLFGDNEPFGVVKTISDKENNGVTRGEFVKIVLESFDLKNKRSEFIKNCYDFLDFCLFNFMAMSSYDGITLKPELVLYPDVSVNDSYYTEITLATILGLVNGHIDQPNSPFSPNEKISRIQALKVIMGATGLVEPLHKFELIKKLGSAQELLNQKTKFEDVNVKISHMWWYPRYVNFALENNIIEAAQNFRPDDAVSVQELNDMINKTLSYISLIKNEKVKPSSHSEN